MIINNAESELPVPIEWRATLCEIVKSFVAKDYSLSSPLPMVTPISTVVSHHIESYISDYGEELSLLPEDTWNYSVYMWQGDYWVVLVDLWTNSEGHSDLVLNVRIYQSEGTFKFNVEMVYVP